MVATKLQSPFKSSAEQQRDRGRDSQPCPRPRLNSQPKGATKCLLVTEGSATTWQQFWGDSFCSLVDVSDLLYFFLLGEGKGESAAPGGGVVVFLLKIPAGWGGVSRKGGEGPGGFLQGIEEFGEGGIAKDQGSHCIKFM